MTQLHDVNFMIGCTLQYPEGYLEAVAAKEKEKENKMENEVAETPTKGKRKRKSQAGKCNLFNYLNNWLFPSTVAVLCVSAGALTFFVCDMPACLVYFLKAYCSTCYCRCLHLHGTQ